MKYSHRFTFRLDNETVTKLQYLAEKEKSSMGRIIRLLIEAAYQATSNSNGGSKGMD